MTAGAVLCRGAHACDDDIVEGSVRSRASASAMPETSLLRPGEVLSAPAPCASDEGAFGSLERGRVSVPASPDAQLDPEPSIPYPRYGFTASDGEGADGVAVAAHLDADGLPSGPAAPLPPRGRSMWREFFLFLGPGFMVCMAYIDPGNLASDINQGSQCGYRLAWVTMWCTALGWATQLLGARLSLHTGHDLAWHARHEYPIFPRLTLWMISELGVVACDMIEVIGGGVAIYALSDGDVPLWGGVLITAGAGFGLLLIERIGMRALEATLAVMVALLGGAFVYLFFSTGVNHGQAFLGLAWPRLHTSEIQIAIGAIGAIIMPHNLYLHSALVLGREKASNAKARRAQKRGDAQEDAAPPASPEGFPSALPSGGNPGSPRDAAGPSASSLKAATEDFETFDSKATLKRLDAQARWMDDAAAAAAEASADRLSAGGSSADPGAPVALGPPLPSPSSLAPAEAVYPPTAPHRALRYVAIESAFALFLSLVVNFCIVSVSAGAFYGTDQAVSLLNVATLFRQMFGVVVSRLWSVGLLAAAFASTVTSTYAGQVIVQGFFGRKINVWWRTAGVRLATLGPTVAVAVAVRGTDENSFEDLTNWLNIVQSLVLPFVIVVMARVSCSKRILGTAALHWPMATLAYLVTLVLVGMNMYLFVSLVVDSLDDKAWGQFLFALAMTIYCSFLIYLALGARVAAKLWRLAGNHVRVRWLGRPEVAPGPVELWGAPDVHAAANAAAAAATAAATVVDNANDDSNAANANANLAIDGTNAGADASEDASDGKLGKAFSADDERTIELQPRF